MDLVDLIQTRRFLGGEFLMWLWYKGECLDGLMNIPEHGNVEIWFDDQMTLEAYLAETERNDLKGGSPAYSPEARIALRQGKRVSKVKLGILKEGREWALSLKAESMDMSGVKIPALLSREEEEQFYERMYLLEELEDIMKALYKEFITIRLSTYWDSAILPKMREWIQSDETLEPKDYPSQALEEGLGIAQHPSLQAADR